MEAFEERRNKQQIIKRMLQLHLIADKSEILPAKASKGKRKSTKNQKGSDSGEESEQEQEQEDYVEEPAFGERQPRQKLAKSKPRQRVRTPLDVGTVRALIAQVDAETYAAALDWLKECLEDASEDTDEAAEDDDGVPLLPLLDTQKDAMELADFQKVLVALGMQPPIVGMESYWRIPSYLNAADLKLRAKIVAGEEVEPDNDSEQESQPAGDSAEDEEEEEEDYLDKRSRERQQAAAQNISVQQQRKLDSLMFNKSDDEAEQREPPTKAKGKRSKKGKVKAKLQQKDSSDELEVNEIARKLARRRRQPDVSSDESDAEQETQRKAQMEQEQELVGKPNTDDLFEQLKAKRATKIKLKDMVLDEASQPATDGHEQDDDALEFNSEGFRARLLELEEEEQEQAQGTEPEESEHDKENATLQANNTIKASSSSAAPSSWQRTRRANVIDSDSDNDDAGAMPAYKTNKRPRSDNEQDAQQRDEPDTDDEDINFLARKKPASSEPAKRRRLAIIDDDDDENNDF